MRLAHISDFHLRHRLPGCSLIGKRRCRQMPGLLAEAIEEVNAHTPDLLVVTGDLVDYPLYAMKDADLLDKGFEDLRLVSELVSRANCPTIVLYGNHDHPAQFREMFKDQSLDCDVDGYRVVTFLDEEQEGNQARRLGEERERFDRVLASIDNRPQIHLQHYLVWPEHNQGYPHSYFEANALRDAIVKSGQVKLALSGHYHTGVRLFEEDGVHFATARAFCEPPHPYRIYDLAPSGIREQEYALRNPPRRTPALFVDQDALLAPLASTDDGISSLVGLSEAGYRLIAILRQRGASGEVRPKASLEPASNTLHGILRERGITVDGLVCRWAHEQSECENSEQTLMDACRDNTASREHTHLVTTYPKEAESAARAGIRNIHLLPADMASAAFIERARKILERGA